ncbi:hypothetical protein [Psychrobacter pygoscelis]|uniref:hypothetical protein n=1 Tax=Psychrobacter pygoscelis TaxID=2488563 RepID=UPI00103E328C|nr:hypothetical protein [Psychrobacter pygoscelis]
MNKSELFKKAHALTKATIKSGDSYSATFAICLKVVCKNSKGLTFKGTKKQVKWAQDAYNRYAAKAKQGVDDLQALKETDARNALQESIIITNIGKVRPVTNQEQLDNLCNEINQTIDSLTAQEWIRLDDGAKFSDKSLVISYLYDLVLNKIIKGA